MQTNFSLAQLADPAVAESEKILRTCVHCGFCTATCPTYVLLGDELDSPRGRIYLIKDMLENDRPASARLVTHIDRCLSCLSCMTTCPSGVHYMHLVDHARVRIEETYRRPALDRWFRQMLALVLPYPGRFRLALLGAWLARPLAGLLPGRLGAMLGLAPARIAMPSKVDRPQVFPAEGERRARAALLSGCARGSGCCGALTHHLGKEAASLDSVKANVAAWCREIDGEGLDAIVINASGCGTVVKDYGFMLRGEPEWAERAARVSEKTKDVSELMSELGLMAPARPTGLAVAYHAACSLQHGQQVRAQPKSLLAAAGFQVRDIAEAHLCCGSAGTYNILQPAIAGQLRNRKVAAIEAVAPEAVATGNIGCLMQISGGTDLPVVHTVELLDWATGGPLPKALKQAGLSGREALAEAAEAAE